MVAPLNQIQAQERLDNTNFTGKFKIIEYNGMSKKSLVEHTCNECNHYRWWVRLDTMTQRGRSPKIKNHPTVGCPVCGKRMMIKHKTMPISEYKERLFNRWGARFDILDYSGIKNNGRFYCHECNNYFNIRADHLLYDHGCPICNIDSLGEKMVFNILKFNHIEYIYQYKVKYKNTAYFYDFYLPENNLIIEVDGIGHYLKKSRNYLSEKDNHDKIKNKIAKDRGIKLIRIKYNDYTTYSDFINNLTEFIKSKLVIPKEKDLMYQLNSVQKEWLKYALTHKLKDTIAHFKNSSKRQINTFVRAIGYDNLQDYKNHKLGTNIKSSNKKRSHEFMKMVVNKYLNSGMNKTDFTRIFNKSNNDDINTDNLRYWLKKYR